MKRHNTTGQFSEHLKHLFPVVFQITSKNLVLPLDTRQVLYNCRLSAGKVGLLFDYGDHSIDVTFYRNTTGKSGGVVLKINRHNV